MKTDLKKLEKSEIEIHFELDEKEFAKYIDKALDHLKEHVRMDGFRPGSVPKDMVKKKVGNENLLMEAGDLAVKENYTKFVNENSLEPISQPEVQILKIVPIEEQSRIRDGETIGTKGPAFIFKVKVAVLPEIELPDYRKITFQVKSKEVSVGPEEVEDALNYLQKNRAKFTTEDRPSKANDFVEIEYENENINSGKKIKDKFVISEGGFMKDFEDNLIGMKAGQEKEFKMKFPDLPAQAGNTPNKALAGKESNFKVKMISVQKMELPEINDEFAKSLGVFDSLIALKENLKEGITMEKKESEKQQKRAEILNKISEKVFDLPAQAGLPEKMAQYEQERLFEDLKNQIENFSAKGESASGGRITFEEYLNSIKKTEEEIKNSFKLEAERRIKNFLVLRQIGKVENIEVLPVELEEEINKTIKDYSKEQLGKIDIEQLKEYTKSEIYNEKVFQFLEKLSQAN